MASFSLLDALDNVMSSIGKHPGAETLMAAIPAAAGAFMLARPYQSSLGTPIGAILAGLGGLGAYQGMQGLSQQREQEQKKTEGAQLATLIGGANPPMGPQQPEQQFVTSALKQGVGLGDIKTAESAAGYTAPSTKSINKLYYERGPGGQLIPRAAVAGQPIPVGALDDKGNVIGKAKPTKPDKITNATELFLSDPKKFAQMRQVEASTRPPPVPKAPPNLSAYNSTEWDPVSGHMVNYRNWVNPKTGTPIKRERVGLKLSGGEQQDLATATQVQAQLPDAIDAATTVQKKLIGMSPAQQQLTIQKQFARYQAGKEPGLLHPMNYLAVQMTPPDQDFDRYFTVMGSMQAQIGAGIKAFRAIKLWQQLSPHVPSPTLTPYENIARLKTLSGGRMQAALNSVAPGESGAISTAPEAPDEIDNAIKESTTP